MFYYLASPYKSHPRGLDAACEEACVIAGGFLRRGVVAVSPLPLFHRRLSERFGGGLLFDDRVQADLEFVRQANERLMHAAFGAIVIQIPGVFSEGVEAEIKYFRDAGKPVFFRDLKETLMEFFRGLDETLI